MNLGDENSGTFSKVIFGKEARDELYVGLKIAANAVAATMGPKGKCVIIQREGQSPVVTKDGVTVSKSINLKNPTHRMGAELIREAASRTNEVAGDGTTTATVLTERMVFLGLKLLAAGYSATDLKRGLEFGTRSVVKELQRLAREVKTSDEVAQIGTISANGDTDIGRLIAEAMEKVGRDGIITVEDAKGMQTSMEVVEGMQFDRGYLSPYFVTDPQKMIVQYSDAMLLITDKKLNTIKDLVPVLESVKQSGRALLIIAEDVEGEVLQTLILNRVRGSFPVVAIKAPGYGTVKDAVMNDIATLAGATYINASSGLKLEQVTAKHLGHVKKITVDGKQTTIVADGRTAPAVLERVVDLKAQMEDITLTDEEREILKARVAKLASGVAVIKVGGTTEMEMVEKRFRIEDALNATKAAVSEGIVAGGGIALLQASYALVEDKTFNESEHKGLDIVRQACRAPIRQIVLNTEHSSEVVLEKLKLRHEAGEMTFGYNAATNKYEDLITQGVIDPVKVTRCALENAASVAATFLSLDAVILEETTK